MTNISMKPKFNDHSPIRFLAEWMFLLFVFFMLWLVYDVAKCEHNKKTHTDKTQWHYEP